MDGFGKEVLKIGDHPERFTTRASIYRKHLEGMKILVAEDNPTNQQVAQAILEGAGIAVTIASNGEEAVQAFKSSSFDAVLMDIQMPKMNGYKATRLIRELPKGASIPIIAMTAHAMKGDEEKCLEAGMNGYVSKPVNQDRMFQTLWRLLGTGKSPSDQPSEWIAPNADEAVMKAGIVHEVGSQDQQLCAAGKTVGKEKDLPDKLPGIDIGRTLMEMGLNDATLTHILVGFLAANRDTAGKIRQAFSDNDPELMGQLAHSLRGSAANIGAADLSMAAQALEEACYKNSATGGELSDLDGKVATLEAALGQVLASIQSLQEPGSDAAAGPANSSCLSLDVLLTLLTDAIDHADPEEIAKIMSDIRQQAAQCTRIKTADLKTLDAQVTLYDYDPALETIRKIRSQVDL